MELPEIPAFTEPDIHDTLLDITISWYKDYPHFVYISFHREYLTHAIPIKKLDTLLAILTKIKTLARRQHVLEND